MKKIVYLLIALSFVIGITIGSSSNVIAQQGSIPSWIKNNAKWWSEGQIDDSEFVKGMQYLIQQGVMKIPNTTPNSSSSHSIPSWIKNNAGWWANGSISDDDFVKGMQYLVQSGIIHVGITQDQTGTPSVQSTKCKTINNLPDPKCTPGAIDPRVTQNTIYETICVSGYTKTVRPSVSVTAPIKLERMQAYGYTDSPSNYELDHLIPLELGGAPSDVNNLWPESHFTNPSAFNKDGLENYLHSQVCSGAIDLHTAQIEIATNWVKYWSGPQSNQDASSIQDNPDSDQFTTQTSQQTNQTLSLGELHVSLQGKNVISRGSLQSMTVLVTDGSNSIVGASVSVHVIYASGSTTKDFDGQTDSSGQYNFSWLIGGNSKPGTFEVDVDASKNGYSSKHDSFSFQVVPA